MREVINPPVSLTIFGAGYDAEPLSQMATALGWRVRLVDHRISYAKPERFPEDAEVLLAPSGQWPPALELTGGEVALIMSHNYLQDQAILKHLLQPPKPLAYIGVLGPRARSQRLLDDLAQEGIVPSEKLFAPAGLDLGANTPEEIALSILAEIQATLSQRPGTALRGGTGPIHPR